MRFAPFYEAGAVMGFSPREVDAMSLWQFFAAADGFIAANTPKGKGAAMSDDEFEAAAAALDAFPDKRAD